MSLVGFSYGTHLGLAAIRRHGEHVERAVLIGTEGPNHTRKLPGTYDVHVRRLGHLVARDERAGGDVPDLADLLRRALDRLAAAPMIVTVDDPLRAGATVEIPVGPFGLQYILVRDLGDASDLPVIPRLLYTIEQGDPSVLRWFVAKRFGELGTLSAMYFVMDSASGAEPLRQARIEQESRHSLLGNAMNFVFPEIDAAWGTPDLGPAFRAPIVSSVPTLFISGTLDSNTPPAQAEEVRWGFTDSTHLVIENAGHEDMLPRPEVQQAIVRFLRGESVRDVTLALPPPRFIPVRGAAPAAMTHPALR
jgi:pimeloyl-ACP methyl ester carboxylesterase